MKFVVHWNEMAFTIDDLNDLLALLRQHPEWRDAVRREVLSRELVELPEIVGRLAEGQAQLTTTVDQLAARMDQLTARVDQLAAKVDELVREVGRLATEMRELGAIVRRLDGRVGNLEGWRYQERFNARGHVTEIVRRPVAIDMADLDPVLDARDDERLSPEEWKQLLGLDFLFRGRLGKGADAPESLVALEVSQVVDSRDVQRAHDRAAILARFGFKTIAAVGGSRLTKDAASLAERLGVRMLVDGIDESE